MLHLLTKNVSLFFESEDRQTKREMTLADLLHEGHPYKDGNALVFQYCALKVQTDLHTVALSRDNLAALGVFALDDISRTHGAKALCRVPHESSPGARDELELPGVAKFQEAVLKLIC